LCQSLAILLCLLLCLDSSGLFSEGAVRWHTSVAMSRKVCCSCHVGWNATCLSCKCAKAGKACTDCYLSRVGKCENPLGTAAQPLKEQRLVCPFPSCTDGRNGRPVSKGINGQNAMTLFRSHVNSHRAAGFLPSSAWLNEHDSRLCPDCSVVIIASASHECSDCKRGPDPVLPPRAQHLPALRLNHYEQLSLGLNDAALNVRLPPLEAKAIVVCSKLPDCCCSCGDTGCDGPVALVSSKRVSLQLHGLERKIWQRDWN
jgi:hypothetical protein